MGFGMIRPRVFSASRTLARSSADGVVRWPAGESELPAWVGSLIHDSRERLEPSSAGDASAAAEPRRISIAVRSHQGWTHVRAIVPDVLRLPRATFEEATRDAYLRVAEAVTALGGRPVRFWNFIPDINGSVGGGVNRYMAFNAGRFHAFERWQRRYGVSDPSPATASGVGAASADLRVHCLASTAGGQRVENPRQVPPTRYSSRYGPSPPSFARATKVWLHGAPVLLIGGTASIVGEDSRHPCDLGAQTRETIDNLRAVIGSATDGAPAPLDRLRQVRVYVRDTSTAVAVRDILVDRCRALTHIELVQAQICRSELLVEIEGIADLS